MYSWPVTAVVFVPQLDAESCQCQETLQILCHLQNTLTACLGFPENTSKGMNPFYNGVRKVGFPVSEVFYVIPYWHMWQKTWRECLCKTTMSSQHSGMSFSSVQLLVGNFENTSLPNMGFSDLNPYLKLYEVSNNKIKKSDFECRLTEHLLVLFLLSAILESFESSFSPLSHEADPNQCCPISLLCCLLGTWPGSTAVQGQERSAAGSRGGQKEQDVCTWRESTWQTGSPNWSVQGRHWSDQGEAQRFRHKT